MFLPLYDYNALRHIRRPYVNYVLIAANIAVFFLTGGFDHYAVENAAVGYGYIPSLAHHLETLPAEYWRLPEDVTYVTYAFLHADWLHLLGNMAFLWVFGDNIEDALGHIRYAIFYIACAAAAAFVHGWVNAASPMPLIGASGAVAGIVGAYLVLHPKVKLWILAFGRIPLRLSAGWVLGFWVLFQLFNVYVANPQEAVAWWAHIGGVLFGGVVVVFVKRRDVPLFDRETPAPG